MSPAPLFTRSPRGTPERRVEQDEAALLGVSREARISG